MNKVIAQVLLTLGCVGMIAFILSAIYWVIFFLWNEVAAGIFGLPELTFWQTVCAVLLFNILTMGLRTVIRSNN